MALLLLACSCSRCDCGYSDEYGRYAQTETESHQYSEPVALVMKELESVVSAKGCMLPAPPYSETDDIVTTSRPAWHGDERYVVRILRSDPGLFRILVLTRHDVAEPGRTITYLSRASDIEQELLRRVDPAAARAVEDEADRRASRHSRAQAVGCAL